jgi:hypothetical protein
MALTNLQKIAQANKPIELSIEDQATIIGLAIKVSNKGVPYFRKETAIAIKEALVADKVITKDVHLFEKLKTSQPDPWYRPVGDWLNLETDTKAPEDDVI